MFAIAFAIAMISASSGDEAETGSELPPPTQVSTGDDQSPEQEQPTSESVASVPSQTAADSPQQEAQQTETTQTTPTQPQQPSQQSQSVEPVAAAEPDPLSGFLIPIAGACITEFEGHLPGAMRAYRNNGVHEGLDFYEWASCTKIDYETPILAAKDGVVIRADLDYVDVTPEDWVRFEAAGFEGEPILDELRGRQIWIEHAGKIVTRYAHLSQIASGIGVGVHVTQGQIIGYAGESGQREHYEAPGTDIHLHFEIRIGESWLGEGLSPLEGRNLYLQAFGLID